MKKSDLLRALQTEIQKHDLSTFMSEKHKIVQTGRSICQKHFGTVETVQAAHHRGRAAAAIG
jgi:hypothetical protein